MLLTAGCSEEQQSGPSLSFLLLPKEHIQSTTSEGAFQWVMQAPVLLFKDSAVFST
jgi:hypothetical protein